MASRTQQPDQSKSRRQVSDGDCRTFRVDRYQLGIDVPLAKRFATVEITRNRTGVRAVIEAEESQWSVRVVDGEIEEQWWRDQAGDDRETLGRLPRWVLVVLDHVGVIA